MPIFCFALPTILFCMEELRFALAICNVYLYGENTTENIGLRKNFSPQFNEPFDILTLNETRLCMHAKEPISNNYVKKSNTNANVFQNLQEHSRGVY